MDTQQVHTTNLMGVSHMQAETDRQAGRLPIATAFACSDSQVQTDARKIELVSDTFICPLMCVCVCVFVCHPSEIP